VTVASWLGVVVPLEIARFTRPGAYLVAQGAESDTDAVLLPGAEIPKGAEVGQALEAFVYLDSEDRPVATLREPVLVLGEVAFLRVSTIGSYGAFVDWGMPKELLVPFAEQTHDLVVGERYPIGLYVDDTGRLAGTMRVAEMLKGRGDFRAGEWVEGQAWRRDPEVGVFVIVEKRFVGLIPKDEPNGLGRGETTKLRVSTVLPDGKMELSLRGLAHEELERDADHVLARLSAPGASGFGDKSSPDEVRAHFGLSKKAFKRAVGRLLARGDVSLSRGGIIQVRGER
jgi:uncharacterized protein